MISEKDYRLLISVRDRDGYVHDFDQERIKWLRKSEYIQLFEEAYRVMQNDFHLAQSLRHSLSPKGENAILEFETHIQNVRLSERKYRNSMITKWIIAIIGFLISLGIFAPDNLIENSSVVNSQPIQSIAPLNTTPIP